jgi:hypothetical protein
MKTTLKGMVVVAASIVYLVLFRIFLIEVLPPVLVGLFIITWSVLLGAGVYLIAIGRRSST